MSATFLDRVPAFKHTVTPEMKREILQSRAQGEFRRRPILRLPLPDKIEDSKKIEVRFPKSKEIEDRIVEFALELDEYGVQSFARVQDYIKTFMRANALLNGRNKVTKSDLFLYDLVHPMFLNSMGEMGMENRILSAIKTNPTAQGNELIKKGGVARGTFYKHKKILHVKYLISNRSGTSPSS